MKKILLLLFFILAVSVYTVELKFDFSESYRIESTVYQNVLFNNKIELSSIILNKYSVNIEEIYKNSAELFVKHHVFQESKGLKQGFYTFHESQEGFITQGADGAISNSSNRSFPAVQSIPQFPDRDLNIGDKWTIRTVEFFDLKNGFQIDDVISTEFLVFYTYRENRVVEGHECAVIDISYNIYEQIRPYMDWGDFYPVKISGGSNQRLYWDIKRGRPLAVEDKFFLDFFLSTGDKYTFKGTTESRSWPKNNLKSTEMLALIDDLEKQPQTTIEESDEYLTITFNSLLFGPESAILKDDVKVYLDKIGKTFKTMGDVNIRIIGHTALFGENDPIYLKDLSTSRARSVAEYLLQNQYIDQKSIEIIGQGGSDPVADNNTKYGRSLNRRVEIEILKN